MAGASWNGAVLAESEMTITVEGNQYFPPGSLNLEYFRKSDVHTSCPWKGTASYYDLIVDGRVNPGAAWFYPDPKPAAGPIRDYVAFWRGVSVQA